MMLAMSQWWGEALAAGAFICYALAVVANRRMAPDMLRLMLFAGWVLHGLMLAEGLLGEPPRFGFAPALSTTVWLVLAVYAIESRLIPQLQAQWALAGLGAASVLLAEVFPGFQLLSCSVYLAAFALGIWNRLLRFVCGCSGARLAHATV